MIACFVFLSVASAVKPFFGGLFDRATKGILRGQPSPEPEPAEAVPAISPELAAKIREAQAKVAQYRGQMQALENTKAVITTRIRRDIYNQGAQKSRILALEDELQELIEADIDDVLRADDEVTLSAKYQKEAAAIQARGMRAVKKTELQIAAVESKAARMTRIKQRDPFKKHGNFEYLEEERLELVEKREQLKEQTKVDLAVLLEGEKKLYAEQVDEAAARQSEVRGQIKELEQDNTMFKRLQEKLEEVDSEIDVIDLILSNDERTLQELMEEANNVVSSALEVLSKVTPKVFRSSE